MGKIDFQTAVIGKSYEKPVVVDFWAPWCGPCRILGPVIEALAAEQADRWELVKINTEEEYEIAQEYRIMSIPSVKMFHRGQVVAEFMGAQPKYAIQQWLDENLPDERKAELAELVEKLRNGEGDEAAARQLEAMVAANPDLREGRLALAAFRVFSDPEQAIELVAPVQLGDPFYEEAENIRALARFLTASFDESPAGERLSRAREAFRAGAMEKAIEGVIEATTVEKGYQDDLPRKTAIALFQHWGADHPLTKNYRWRFDMALY